MVNVVVASLQSPIDFCVPNGRHSDDALKSKSFLLAHVVSALVRINQTSWPSSDTEPETDDEMAMNAPGPDDTHANINVTAGAETEVVWRLGPSER